MKRKMKSIQIPKTVRKLISRLREGGFTAYAVGGCVRDTLLGRTPKDWDLCTSALPEQMKELFAGERLVETGLKHGTLTVVVDQVPYEITTYRVDGSYTDHRHPDSVAFVDQIDQDLARRDFTVNAMACDADGEILDFFDGQRDLEGNIIRCVGKPKKRFSEDALRILRAMRFASVLDFQIEEETARAVHELHPALAQVAAERIRTELTGLLCGPGAGRILREYTDVITFLIPCLKASVNYQQDNPHHLYTVWEHIIRAVEGVPPEPVLRMTMLLHDAGKPYTRTTDEKGVGHYKGHQACSAALATEVLEKLRFDRESEERIVRLVEAHDIPLSTERKILLRRLNKFGEKDLRALFQIHRADRIATGTRNPKHAEEHCRELNEALDALLAENPCFMLKDLAVNGRDLMVAGLQGKEIGETLDRLLEMVMDGQIMNEREALMDEAAKDIQRITR